VYTVCVSDFEAELEDRCKWLLELCKCGISLSLALSVMCMWGSGVGTRAVYKLTLSCKGEFRPALTPDTSIMRDLSEGVCV